LSDSYKSVNEALRHAGMRNHARVLIDHIDSETITPKPVPQLAQYDGSGARRLWRAWGGRQDRHRPFCPQQHVPYLGICLGMQVATIEYARHVAGLARRQQHRV
jgi:CTP synthase